MYLDGMERSGSGWLLVTLLAGIAVGCSGRLRSPHGGAKGSATHPGAGGASAASGTSFESGGADDGGRGGTLGGAGASRGGSGPSGVGGGGSTASCTPGVPVTSQVPRLTGAEYDRTVRDLLGVTGLSASGNIAPSSFLAADQPGSVTDIAWSAYQYVGEQISTQVLADPSLKSNFIRCTPEPGNESCFHDTIVEFGRRAFRRPLDAEEIDALDALVAKGPQITEHGTDDEIAEVLLYTFLVSPSFLQRAEVSQATDGEGHFALSSVEIAQRLSYLLWGSTPDALLDQAADADELTTPAQILAQAERLLADPRAHDRVAEFHRYYLAMSASSGWSGVDHDPAKYPAFSKELVPAMVAETEKFFDDVVFAGAGEFKDLLLSNKAFVTAGTAPLYGLDPASYGADLTETTLDPAERPGFLTRLGFLNAYSSYDRSSPIRRGGFINARVLGFVLGPDEGAPSPPPLDANVDTNRKQVEAMTAGAACAGCHVSYVNPPGFVLEAFDGAGAWQTVEAATGAPIDTTADVIVDQDTTVHVANPAELMDALASSSSARHAYASRWISFAYGREADPGDACTLDELGAKMSAGSYPVLRLVADLTQTLAFRTRVVDTAPAP